MSSNNLAAVATRMIAEERLPYDQIHFHSALGLIAGAAARQFKARCHTNRIAGTLMYWAGMLSPKTSGLFDKK
ncbi:MAG: hypothetical protein ACHP7O_14705 [Burkholderiales bacterium]